MPGHVFLSYCREDQALVAALRKDLIAAGEKVWWDQDLLPGQDWKLAIWRALKKANAVVACFSENTEKRYRSGIFPELRNAIEIYRNHAPGQIFLIPIRFSDCTLPDLEIDATRYLTDLQYVDLFPETQRKHGTEKLLEAIARAPSRSRPLGQAKVLARKGLSISQNPSDPPEIIITKSRYQAGNLKFSLLSNYSQGAINLKMVKEGAGIVIVKNLYIEVENVFFLPRPEMKLAISGATLPPPTRYSIKFIIDQKYYPLYPLTFDNNKGEWFYKDDDVDGFMAAVDLPEYTAFILLAKAEIYDHSGDEDRIVESEKIIVWKDENGIYGDSTNVSEFFKKVKKQKPGDHFQKYSPIIYKYFIAYDKGKFLDGIDKKLLYEQTQDIIKLINQEDVFSQIAGAKLVIFLEIEKEISPYINYSNIKLEEYPYVTRDLSEIIRKTANDVPTSQKVNILELFSSRTYKAQIRGIRLSRLLKLDDALPCFLALSKQYSHIPLHVEMFYAIQEIGGKDAKRIFMEIVELIKKDEFSYDRLKGDIERTQEKLTS